MNIKEAIKIPKGYPEYIHPQKRERIEKGEKPISKLFPSATKSQSYMELIASDRYKEVVDNLKKYLGTLPTLGRAPVVFGQVLGALAKVKNIEKNHKEELEQLAIDTVLMLPEFKPLKDQYDSGSITIDAKIVDPGEVEEPPQPPKEDISSEEVDLDKELFEILNNLDGEKLKRKFANVMIQGSAVSKFYLFEFVKERLDAIDPKLTNLYGTILSITDVLYWITPFPLSLEGTPKLGEEKIEYDKEGKATINAQGIIFPILVHELVKSAMEIVSHSGLPQDLEAKKEVLSKVDMPESEILDIMIGPALWKRFSRLIPIDKQHLLLNVYQKILTLPVSDADEIADEFKQAVQNILQGGTRAELLISQLLKEVQQEIDEYEKTDEYKDIGEEEPPEEEFERVY